MHDVARELLRHAIATVAYRGAKTLRGAPASFSEFSAGSSSRTAGQILAHIGDLFDWALSIARGEPQWQDSSPLAWASEVSRFHRTIAAFDEYLASGLPLHGPAEQLFQGPVADALSHVGQLALLRRLAQAPIKGENYFKADIAAGRVGAEQSAPRREFE